MGKKKKGKEKKKKKIKGMREVVVKKVKNKETQVERYAPTGVAAEINAWWGEFEALKGDNKVKFLYDTFAREESVEFWEGLELFDAVDTVFNYLASKGRLEEGITLVEKLKEQKPAQYMADYLYYDYYLLHYYAPRGERERIKEIMEHFEVDPERGIDHIEVALVIFRLYGMAEETCQLSRWAYQKLKGSDEVMPGGIIELHQRATFCAIRGYITSPNYGEAEAEQVFSKTVEALELEEELEVEEEFGEEIVQRTMDDERLWKTVKTLRGEIRRDWKREDFMVSHPDYEDNVYLFIVEFIRYLHIEKSFEWVTGDLFFEVVMEYFYDVPEEGGEFYFCFSKEYLDEYLSHYLSLFSIKDAKGMVILKALDYFASFTHQRGIFTDDELKEVESAIEEFSVLQREMDEELAWKYRFLERFL
jgi:hypothetical protein